MGCFNFILAKIPAAVKRCLVVILGGYQMFLCSVSVTYINSSRKNDGENVLSYRLVFLNNIIHCPSELAFIKHWNSMQSKHIFKWIIFT